MRIEDHAATPAATHTVDQLHGEYSLRLTHTGAISKLEQAYNGQSIEAFHDLDAKRNRAKGKEKNRLKTMLAEQFPHGEPKSQYPSFSIRTNYRRIEPTTPDLPHSLFDPNLIVLGEAEDTQQTFGLESTSLVVTALRDLIMSKSPIQPPPAWVSGHESNGEKLQSSAHIALIPLAFVGSPYADGHLMGAGIIFPRSVSYMDRARVLSGILFNQENNDPAILSLLMGKAGTWRIARDTSPPHQQTLQANNYTRASQTWASVTPIVLDRMPKADRVNDPIGWREQTAEIIARSCVNIDLPEPSSVRVEKTPFFRGSLRAMPGQGGFPLLRQGRFQVHAMLTFSKCITGPVLIGAGRFRGYGLCRPWRDEQ
jgi:CRISPR-associated protein Csb2